jgi:hypothetical protein
MAPAALHRKISNPWPATTGWVNAKMTHPSRDTAVNHRTPSNDPLIFR